MKKQISRIALVAVLFSGSLFSFSAQAQGLQAELVHVNIWPEYDRKETLVIQNLVLPSNTPLPQTVFMAMPKAAGEPHAVAWRGENDNLYLAKYNIRDNGDARYLEILAEGHKVQFEYYLPFSATDSKREITIHWYGTIDTKQWVWELQKPLDAKELKVEPTFTDKGSKENGVEWYAGQLGPQKLDQLLSVKISYLKDSDALTKTLLANAPAPKPLAEQKACEMDFEDSEGQKIEQGTLKMGAKEELPPSTTGVPGSHKESNHDFWFMGIGFFVIVAVGFGVFKKA
ncbi:hypothetical protein KAI87_00200 [Myxococcota bacterium]|nr:hypothetical protein [Myxococcota bacterium]